MRITATEVRIRGVLQHCDIPKDKWDEVNKIINERNDYVVDRILHLESTINDLQEELGGIYE